MKNITGSDSNHLSHGHGRAWLTTTRNTATVRITSTYTRRSAPIGFGLDAGAPERPSGSRRGRSSGVKDP
ncbi:MAG: hypothetical protein M5U19_22085 [Microthrixaceae bacterium]|nr:hypothetical protein [Microthrixaceae bacterium]